MILPSFFARIFSQFYKNLHGIFRNHFRLADVFLWPIIYLFTLSFFISYANLDSIYLNIIVLGMIGWRAIYFMSAELVSSYMEDYWSKSLALLHISPISRFEFALGSSLSGFFKTLIVIVLYFIVATNLYSFSIVRLDLFLIGLFFLIICGLSLGLLVLGLTYENRESAFSLSFLIPDVVALISGVYFSISEVFPPAVSSLLKFLPTVHAFNAIKSASGTYFEFDFFYLILSSVAFLIICERVNLFFYLRAKKSGKLGRFG